MNAHRLAKQDLQLLEAAAAFDLSGVRLQAEAGMANVNARGRGGKSALHLAAKSDRGDAVVEYLLAHGAMVDGRCDDGVTPLMEAAADGSIRVIKLLLAAGADKSATENDGKMNAEAFAKMGQQTAAAELLA